MKTFSKPLFVFEMANNHQGDIEHGKNIIRAMRQASAPFVDRFDFAVKFQYRDLDSFIHPAFQDRMDIKNVKRFQDTRLSREQFAELLACTREEGFLTMCTPFDEVSAARIAEEGYDFIKIASCSFGDWPLMEAIAATGLPVVASGAGSPLEVVRRVVSFFTHRNLPFVLMHCVGEYPTPDEHLQMNQIDLYRREFPELTIGFSTHEAPDNMEPVKIAVAKGARVFEKHVGLPTETVTLNGYSANPQQVAAWLAAADAAFRMCGTAAGRYEPSDKEAADLAALRRGAFLKKDLPAGTMLGTENVFFAFPCQPGQLLAQDFSKYATIRLNKDMRADAAVQREDVELSDTRGIILRYVNRIVDLLKQSNVVVPVDSRCEISHHYGLENFEKTGLTLIDCVNREYCKKILVVLPGQAHPSHSHKKKEETFIVLDGELKVNCCGKERIVRKGETMTVERDQEHSFSSDSGCVFEEISTTHYRDDSFYPDAGNFVQPRKTQVYLTRDIWSR